MSNNVKFKFHKFLVSIKLKKYKRVFYVLLILLLVIIIYKVFFIIKEYQLRHHSYISHYTDTMQVQTDEKMVETLSDNLAQKKSIDNITVEEFKVYRSLDGMFRYKLVVKNISTDDIANKYLKLKFLGENGKEIETLDFVISSLNSNQSKIVFNTSIKDLTKSEDYILMLQTIE